MDTRVIEEPACRQNRLRPLRARARKQDFYAHFGITAQAVSNEVRRILQF